MNTCFSKFRALALAALTATGAASTALAMENGGASGRWQEVARNQIELHALAFDAQGIAKFKIDAMMTAAVVGQSRVQGAATLLPHPGEDGLTVTYRIVGILDRRADGSASLRAALFVDEPEGLRAVGTLLGELAPLASSGIDPATPVAVESLAPAPSSVAHRGVFRARWKLN